MPIPAPDNYVIYGGELSLFTRKLEAALIFYGADCEFQPKAGADVGDIESRSGTHQVPVLHTPENWMIADTTPLLQLLDARFPHRRMFPQGPIGVLTHVLEEFFDEWVARVMVHFRWHYEASAVFASERMANGNRAAAERVRGWGPRACRATGTESPQQRQEAEAEYVRLLSAAETQLASTRFLLGDRPTAVDCIVLGGLRAHTDMDPDPKKVTAQFPRVLEWSRSSADQWDGTGELAPFPESTPFATQVLDELVAHYVPVLSANQAAHAAGAKAFHADAYGESVSYLCRAYPALSARMIGDRLNQTLRPEERTATQSWLQRVGLAACFA